MMPPPGIGRKPPEKKGLLGGWGAVVRRGAMTKLFSGYRLATNWLPFGPKERAGRGILPVRMWIRWSDGTMTSEEYARKR